MSQSRDKFELLDADERERAVSTFERNLVVTAGAGTGKTTLLVDRLVHLLLRNPDPLRITEIVALTFTNKAANEMKLRLRERLQSYLAVRLDWEPVGKSERKAKDDVEALLARYQPSKDEVDRRVHDALRNIERSDIGTIHSFAANLLRLYPLEAGVDPQFHEDDGNEFDRLFDERWDLWLDQELCYQWQPSRRLENHPWKCRARSYQSAGQILLFRIRRAPPRVEHAGNDAGSPARLVDGSRNERDGAYRAIHRRPHE